MRLFSERSLGVYLETKRIALDKDIQSEDKDRLLSMNESEYVKYLVEKYSIDPLVFHWDHITISSHEKMIQAEYFPKDIHTREGKSYSRQVVQYHLPISGDNELLRYKPNEFSYPELEVDVRANIIIIDIINWRDDVEAIKYEAERTLNSIKSYATEIDKLIQGYNSTLENLVKDIVQKRKGQILKQANILASLGIPLKRESNIPLTFAVPITPQKIKLKPNASKTPFVPEPTLSNEQYREILQIISDTGISIERSPHVYLNKSEEQLRDYLVMVLSTHFPSVTGETRNRGGKTDVLIRHENSNLFVAECKVWKGIKRYLDTIDQILSYLTWRDSKSAIVIFVHNQELQPVLDQVGSKTKEHPAFVKYYGKTSESWFDFEFHLKDDSTRSVQLAVLCFHFPEKTSDDNQ